MRIWHSFYEIIKLPVGVLLLGVLLLGIGNAFTNTTFSVLYSIRQPVLLTLANLCSRIGIFIVINFPLILLLRVVSRKNGSATTVLAALFGYGAFQCATMVVSAGSLPSIAYSSILGISMNMNKAYSSQVTTIYPIQTGLIATMIVALITLIVFDRNKNRNTYGFFGFISSPCMVVFMTTFFSALAGILIGLIWPGVYACISKVIHFISADTSNPINLALYGITDKLLSLLNQNSLIRNPFWYTVSGGSWINTLSGTSIAGDASIWTAQMAGHSMSGVAGRFFTPYYIVNIFVLPAMLLAAFTLQTDKLERRKSALLYLSVTVISMLAGVSLPIEILLLILCPFLYILYLGGVGILYIVCQCFHVYLGFNTTGTLTMTALPGTLLELISDLKYSYLQTTIWKVCCIGMVAGIFFFILTRLYFRYLAVDLFNTGGKERLLKETLKSVGGLDNIKAVSSSCDTLTIALYDISRLNVDRLRKMGVYRVMETKAGFALSIGNSATMLKDAIRDSKRNTNRTTG